VLLAGGAAVVVGITRPGGPAAAVRATSTCHVAGTSGCELTADGSGAAVRSSAEPAQVLPANVTRACDLNEQMRKAATDGSLWDLGLAVSQIQALAGNSTIVDIKVQANMLKTWYDRSVAATDDPGSTAATMNLLAVSTQLSTACRTAGWASP
jgi:hypothetical protein